jgi:hypothetical protein
MSSVVRLHWVCAANGDNADPGQLRVNELIQLVSRETRRQENHTLYEVTWSGATNRYAETQWLADVQKREISHYFLPVSSVLCRFTPMRASTEKARARVLNSHISLLNVIIVLQFKHLGFNITQCSV